MCVSDQPEARVPNTEHQRVLPVSLIGTAIKETQMIEQILVKVGTGLLWKGISEGLRRLRRSVRTVRKEPIERPTTKTTSCTEDDGPTFPILRPVEWAPATLSESLESARGGLAEALELFK
jgi:hypothetical protein